MADTKKPAKTGKAVTAKENAKLEAPKRRLRTQPTLREKTERASETRAKSSSKVKQGMAAPFRALGRGLTKVWRGKAFTPLRWVGRVIVPRYFRNAFAELKLVQWPKARLVWRLTGAVLLFGLIMGLAVAGLDWAFEKLFREVLLG